jgi:ABC-type Fe3+-siderophore transport system permease subunit
MSADVLRHRALQRQAKARLEAYFSVIIGLVLSIFFAWTFTRAHTVLARMGWALLSLWGIYAAYHAYKWVWPQNLPEDAPVSTCLKFYRRELEKRRDYLRHRWWRLLPFLLLGMAMVIVGTGAQAAPPNPLLAALPFFLVLAIWAVAFFVMKKKLGRENLRQEIEELRAFETENRS